MCKTISVPIIFHKENSLKYNQELIKEYILNNHKTKDFPIYGEMSHNDNRLWLNINELTHKIKNVSLIDNELIAEIEILDTPNGKIFQEIHKIFPINLTPRVLIDGDNKNNCQLISIDLNIT